MKFTNRFWHTAECFAFIFAMLAVAGSAANADNPQIAQVKTVSGQVLHPAQRRPRHRQRRRSAVRERHDRHGG